MFGNERTEKLVLVFFVLAFIISDLVSLSIWLTVFFGLMTALQALGVIRDMTTIWVLKAPPRERISGGGVRRGAGGGRRPI